MTSCCLAAKRAIWSGVNVALGMCLVLAAVTSYLQTRRRLRSSPSLSGFCPKGNATPCLLLPHSARSNLVQLDDPLFLCHLYHPLRWSDRHVRTFTHIHAPKPYQQCQVACVFRRCTCFFSALRGRAVRSQNGSPAEPATARATLKPSAMHL